MKFSINTLFFILVAMNELLTVVRTLPKPDDAAEPIFMDAPSYESSVDDTDDGDDEDFSGDFETPEHDAPHRVPNEIWKVNINHTKVQDLFQGDIRLDLVQKMQVNIDRIYRQKRAARSREREYLWKHNTVYYKIDSGFSRDTKMELKRGIRHWKKSLKHCLKFVRLDKNPGTEESISKKRFGGGPVDHILFTKTNSGCWSQVGRTDTRINEFPYVPGRQLISIGEGCGEKGTVIHEIGHAIGFWHEQSRRDRDSFVKIVRHNIMSGQKLQFRRLSKKDVNSMGYAYDFWSIMHYGPTFFSKNGKPTIRVQKKYRYLKPEIGQRRVLSYLDVAQVRAMYKCNVLPSRESTRTCVSKKTKGRDYRGKLDYTEKGVMCQPWNKKYPHSHKYKLSNKSDGLGRHNHCRNPGGEKERPWCFTTYGKDRSTWQYCDIKTCDS